ncbi:hypothetical protein NDA16_001095 [Ustilago loliicola]|nr:hypothetical protein NDA16_001095 [Ustilago loliicola]
MNHLRIATWNCNGINTRAITKPRDWDAITEGVDVLLLQETCFSSSRSSYTTSDPNTLFQSIAPPLISATVHSAYATPFCAVIILNPLVTISNAWHTSTQRVVSCQLHVRDFTFSVVSVYAPAKHAERQAFFESFPMRSVLGSHPAIMGGD